MTGRGRAEALLENGETPLKNIYAIVMGRFLEKPERLAHCTGDLQELSDGFDFMFSGN